MPKTISRAATADKIAALIRIYRAAAVARDEALRLTAAAELAQYGILAGDLVIRKISEVRHAK